MAEPYDSAPARRVGPFDPIDGGLIVHAANPTAAGSASEGTLLTRASEATLATRATEATLATRATEATLASLLSATGPAYRRTKKHVEFIPSSAAPTTIYTGFAPNGTADAAAAWTIQRLVFTGVTNIDETWTTVGTASWTGRATETYT